MKVFHGTRSVDSIMATGLRPSTGGEFGPGIYLTQNEGTAAFYALYVAHGPNAPAILSLRISLKNPYRVTKLDWIKLTQRSTPRTVQRRLVKKGYDSIIGIGLTGDEQIVAWYPEQVLLRSVEIYERLNPSIVDSWWAPRTNPQGGRSSGLLSNDETFVAEHPNEIDDVLRAAIRYLGRVPLPIAIALKQIVAPHLRPNVIEVWTSNANTGAFLGSRGPYIAVVWKDSRKPDELLGLRVILRDVGFKTASPRISGMDTGVIWRRSY